MKTSRKFNYELFKVDFLEKSFYFKVLFFFEFEIKKLNLSGKK